MFGYLVKNIFARYTERYLHFVSVVVPISYQILSSNDYEIFIGKNICQMFSGKNICQMFIGKNICQVFLGKNICQIFIGKNICQIFIGKDICQMFIGKNIYQFVIGKNICQIFIRNICFFICFETVWEKYLLHNICQTYSYHLSEIVLKCWFQICLTMWQMFIKPCQIFEINVCQTFEPNICLM